MSFWIMINFHWLVHFRNIRSQPNFQMAMQSVHRLQIWYLKKHWPCTFLSQKMLTLHQSYCNALNTHMRLVDFWTGVYKIILLLKFKKIYISRNSSFNSKLLIAFSTFHILYILFWRQIHTNIWTMVERNSKINYYLYCKRLKFFMNA